jgi:hypothetical protein
VQRGLEFKEFPDNIAQLGIIANLIMLGNVIFSLPADVKGFLIVILNVYLVIALTVEDVSVTEPDRSPVTAVNV